MLLTNFIIHLLFFSLILLTFLLITNPIQVNKKANIWFGLFTFVWATFWLDEIVLSIGHIEIQSHLTPFIGSIQFLAPIFLYLSILFFTHPNYKFTKRNLWYLVTPLLYSILLFLQGTTNTYQAVLLGIMLSHSAFYCISGYLILRKHKKDIKLFSSNPHEYDLSWLEQIIYTFVAIVILVTLFNIIFYNTPLNTYMNLAMLASAYFIAYNVMKQKDIYPIDEKQTEEVISIGEEQSIDEEKRKIVSDEKLVELKAELNTLMQEKEPYLNSELNLINLSELLSISPHILSYVINTGFHVNFPQFVNKYRVEKAKLLLQDSKTSKTLSILGIAYESGFNSKTVFNTTFKKITGKTPSAFKKKGSNS